MGPRTEAAALAGWDGTVVIAAMAAAAGCREVAACLGAGEVLVLLLTAALAVTTSGEAEITIKGLVAAITLVMVAAASERRTNSKSDYSSP